MPKVYLVKERDTLNSKLFKTAASLPLNHEYTYWELDVESMELTQVPITSLRKNHAKAIKDLQSSIEELLIEVDQPSHAHERDYLLKLVENRKKLIDIFS